MYKKKKKKKEEEEEEEEHIFSFKLSLKRNS